MESNDIVVVGKPYPNTPSLSKVAVVQVCLLN